MRLTVEQIKSITVGALRIAEEEDGIHFYKCTQKQIDAWGALSQGLGERSAGTTGIRLDFHTNSQSVAFYLSGGTKYELDVDGLLRAQYHIDQPTEIRASLCDPLGAPKAESRVTLYLPSHGTGGVLSYVELDDGARITPHRFDRKMLFVGDSITQGWDSTYDSLSYAYRVSRYFNAESVIQGIGGAYYHESTFDRLPFDPDIVLVAYGTNDFGHYKTLEELRAHVSAHLSLLAREYTGKKCFALSPIWRDHRDGKAMGSFADCRRVIIEEIERVGWIHIDGLTLVPPMPAFFKDEYLHPHDNGFSLYAENLIPALEKYL